ncbi:MAG: hypothetical protein JO306_16545 [Gemmatimonadetes bacterium]|nr:hypothetical protein [Gemmatimonadota bacterium]
MSGLAAAAGAVLVCIAVFARPLLYDCRLGERGIEIVLFRRLRVLTYAYADISDARVTSIPAMMRERGLFSNSARWWNRWLGDPVLVCRRGRGDVILTPRAPREFVAAVRARMAA